jgi:signal transduction histidine kinase
MSNQFIIEKKYRELFETPNHQHTILLVDDEEYNLYTLRDMLSKMYNILTAKNGAEAIEILKKEHNRQSIHLIITDQRMPQMDGVEFLKNSLHLLPMAKRIILSAYADINIILRYINDIGIYQFILKPPNNDMMLMTIKRALEAYQLEFDNRQLLEELRVKNNMLEQSNSNLEKTVDEQTRELRQQTKELEASNETKNLFFSMVSHDLKAPNRSIDMQIEQMMELNAVISDPEVCQSLSEIKAQNKHLQDILDNLLDWSRSQMGQIQCLPYTYNISRLITKIVTVYNRSAEQNIFSVVLSNLLNNAIKYSYTNQEITITACIHDGYLEISVIDQGIGIRSQDLDKCFRIDQTRQLRSIGTMQEKGTGLGLILCKSLLEIHKGDIHVTSEYNKGSHFCFRLPINMSTP